jgi:hypothetical protein
MKKISLSTTRLKPWYYGVFIIAITIAVMMPWHNTQSEIKWEPGYYIKVKQDAFEELLQEREKFEEALNDRNIKGFFVSVYWRQIERSKDNYDMSAINQLLNFMEEHNKYLILGIYERNFTRNCEGIHNPVPDYIYQMDGVSRLASVAHNRQRPGCASKLWKPEIMGRYIKLLQAIAHVVDSHPRFVAYSSPESALRVNESYDKDELAEQYKRLAREATRAFPTSVTLISLNWLGGIENIRDIAEELASSGRGGITTSDTVPSEGINGVDVYPIMQEFKGRIAIAPRADTSLLEPQDTEIEINSFAVNELGANYLIWSHWRRGTENYIETTVLPTINQIVSHPNEYPQLIKACPSTFSICK